MCTICNFKIGDKVKWNKAVSSSESWTTYYPPYAIYTVKSIEHGNGWFKRNGRYGRLSDKPGCFIEFQEVPPSQGWDSTELIKIQTKQLKLKLP